VNGDGLDDLVVGAPGADHGAVSGELGAAYVFVGPFSAGSYSATAARARLDGETSADECGSAVALVPDVTGDDRADVLIGAARRREPGAVGAAVQYGGAYLVDSESL
jgi:hypothetical protein